ncbi:MAG: glycoside hydrolase family 16 protein, partial [Nocardioides sp.]|nr:glycoside hydrolase family 16 protein [Nocardioides sp.]
TLHIKTRMARVTFSGRTAVRSARLVLQRARGRGSRWLRVRRVRSRNFHYRATVRRPKVATRYRVVWRGTGRTSPVRRVRPRRRPAAPTVPRDACGPRPQKADGSRWKCTFSDEFNGGGLDRTKWIPQSSGYRTGTSEKFACYTEDNVTVRNGSLRLRLIHGAPQTCQGANGNNETTPYTAGSVSTYRLFSQRYGRFEARMRNTAADVAGLQETFWLWPDDREVQLNWPLTGEIDIAETYSSHPELVIPFLHSASDALGNVWKGPLTNTALCDAERGRFNTYRLEWGPSKIRIFVNGTLCLTNTSGDPAFRHKYILAFTQAIGAKGNEATAATPIPATTEVDWVRVWQ